MRLFNKCKSILLLIIMMAASGSMMLSQTAGNLTFSVTTSSTGGFSPKHLLAIWIENNAATFVKTKIMYSSASNLDHLGTWTSKSGSNIVDAISGATLSTNGAISFIWNGTDASGSIVSDGTYVVWVEMAWASSLTTGKAVSSFSFVKGPSVFNSSPASTANLTVINLAWSPAASATNDEIQTKDFIAFPNPSHGLVNIDFRKPVAFCNIQVINDAGILVYKKSIHDVPIGIKTLDINTLAAGAYYITLRMNDQNVTFRIIRLK